MARPKKQTADYFPHSAVHGKTMFIIEAQYGIAGYAAWFKLLEVLCTTPGHCYYCVTEADTAFLTAKTGFKDTETLFRYTETLVACGAIDAELWRTDQGIWSQNLVDNLTTMYSKRLNSVVPQKPVSGHINPVSVAENPVKVTRKPQSKVKETKGKEKEKETTDGPFAFNFLGTRLDSTWMNDLAQEFSDIDFTQELKKCIDYWSDNNRKVKSPKLALRNWMAKAREINQQHLLGNPKEKRETGVMDSNKFYNQSHNDLVRR